LIQRPRFLSGDQSLPEWEELPIVPLAPEDYGLVVIDRDTQWMGHLQSYTDPARLPFDAVKRSLDRGPVPIPDTGNLLGYHEGTLFQEAWRAGALPELVFVGQEAADQVGVPWQEMAGHRGWTPGRSDAFSSWLAAVERLPRPPAKGKGSSRGESEPEFFRYAPPGWHIQGFGLDRRSAADVAAGHVAFAEALLDRGFALSTEQALTWDLHIAEKEEDGVQEKVGPVVQRLLAERMAAGLEEVLKAPPSKGRSSLRL
jgi:hypothetical protein